MTIKRNLFVGAAISMMVASTLLVIGRSLSRKTQADWHRERWLRLLSGANSSK